MEACLDRLRTTALATTLGVVSWCAVATADDAIRLPSWVEPADEVEAVEQAAYEPAPRPRPMDYSPKLLSPPPRLAAIGAETDATRLVRQLEHAATTAQSRHALTRLLRRCDETLTKLDTDSDAPLREQAKRVMSWAYHARGRLATQAGDAEEALADFRAAVEANPKNTAAQSDLAVALADAGDNAGALEAIGRVLAIDPDSVTARQNRATLRLSAGKAELAIADCDAALAGLPADSLERAPTLLTRGAALHVVGRLREAAADLDEALRLEPKLANARTARGHVYAEAGYYQQAIDDYRGALDADPASIEAYRSLAWLLATCPQKSFRSPQTAIEAAWRARRLLGSEDFLTLDASAAAHAAAGEFAEAVRLQQRAMQVIPSGDQAAAAEAQQRLRLYEGGRAYVAVGPATVKR